MDGWVRGGFEDVARVFQRQLGRTTGGATWSRPSSGPSRPTRRVPDPRRDLALAMVCNRGTGTPIGDLRMAQLGTVLDRAARRRGPSAP